MTTSEKIVALRDLTGLNQNRFAKLIGVAPSTMTRLERGTPNAPSLDTLQKLVDTFPEVTLDWLQDETNTQVPERLTGTASSPQEFDDSHEGKRLRAFVNKNKPTLNQYVIAEAMGVSRNQVTSYYNTGRFRNSVQQSLLTALSKLLGRTISADEVFGSAKRTDIATPTSLIAIPRIALSDRPKIEPAFLDTLQANFMPAVRPETALYAPKQAVTPDRLRLAFAIEVGGNDHMEPLYFPGYWVLGIRMEPTEYAKLYDGVVGVLTNDGEFLLKKVLANNLRTTDVLELGSYTIDRGGSVQLRKSDIQVMFSIQGILYGII